MSTLVIGSSGFLGRVVTAKLLKESSGIPTHFENPTFPYSVPFDLLQDDPTPLFGEVTTIIFCAGIEPDNSASSVEHAMTQLLAACGDRRFIYLSSDAIFAGDRGNYREDETPAPITPYGRNLLRCETLVRKHCPDSLIVRPSYIYGYSAGHLDSRLSRTLSAVRAGETVSLFEDMFKCPLGVEQVAEAVVRLSRSRVTGTLHVAGPRLSVLEFYQQALGALGENTANLVGVAMPEGKDFQRDTSLDTSKWQALSGTRPLSVAETLRTA